MSAIQAKNIDSQWVFGKFTYIFFWLFSLYHALLIENNIIYPVGIFQLAPLQFLFSSQGKILIALVSFVAIVLYLSEKRMLLATGLMAVTSILIISYQDSNGIFHRNTHYAAIFTAQFIAYLSAYYSPSFQLSTNRISFSFQIIAGIYFLAALSKLESSGLNWFLHPENFTLQLYKNHFYLFADDNDCKHIIFSNQTIAFFETYPLMQKILLGISLFLEFFCFLILVNDRWRYPIALGLISMHLGISYFMGIGISSIATAVIAWMINPCYVIYLFRKKLLMRNGT